MRNSTSCQSFGFTLIEVLVVITIMTIITAVTLTALPLARTDQMLESDIIQLKSALSQAQQRALNEIRTPDCLALAGDDSELQRRCSDIGVVILEERIVTFSDLTGDQDYVSSGDLELEAQSTSSGPPNGTPISIVFTASPPNVTTFVNGQVIGAGQSAPVTLQIGETSREFSINPYGILEDVAQE